MDKSFVKFLNDNYQQTLPKRKSNLKNTIFVEVLMYVHALLWDSNLEVTGVFSACDPEMTPGHGLNTCCRMSAVSVALGLY